MPLLRTLFLLLICCIMGHGLFAQNSLKKAETYYQLNAHFLSIKYFQKHLKDATTDREAMLKLAECYQKADMPQQSRKWLLKANGCKDLPTYFRKIASAAATENVVKQSGANLLKNQIVFLFQKESFQNLSAEARQEKSLMAMTFTKAVCSIY